MSAIRNGTIRAFLMLGACLVGGTPAHGQQELFNNGRGAALVGLDTGNRSRSNVLAPAGWRWSEAGFDSTGVSAMAGFAASSSNPQVGARLADDFAISQGGRWSVQTLRFFAYTRNAVDTANPVGRVDLRIWQGRPEAPGSTLIYDSGTRNLPTTATRTNLYRVFSSTGSPSPVAPDTKRPIWQIDVSLGSVMLDPGVYWLDWQFVPALPGVQVFVPPVTPNGSRAVAGANALQRKQVPRLADPQWTPIVDLGKPSSTNDVGIDLPFVVLGAYGCDTDYNRDGITNLDDLADFFADFETRPSVPGGLQPAAPSYSDRAIGYGVPCAGAGDAPPPYAPGAYRQFGYRTAFTSAGSSPCPAMGPDLDNLADYLTAYFGGGC